MNKSAFSQANRTLVTRKGIGLFEKAALEEGVAALDSVMFSTCRRLFSQKPGIALWKRRKMPARFSVQVRRESTLTMPAKGSRGVKAGSPV